jgi:hypothetical protein
LDPGTASQTATATARRLFGAARQTATTIFAALDGAALAAALAIATAWLGCTSAAVPAATGAISETAFEIELTTAHALGALAANAALTTLTVLVLRSRAFSFLTRVAAFAGISAGITWLKTALYGLTF